MNKKMKIMRNSKWPILIMALITLSACKKEKKIIASSIYLAGVHWAPGNLLYTDGVYSFTATQEHYTGAWNGGDYWNWCMLSPTNYTSYGKAYCSANDPCQKVAPTGTWRMPTQEELDKLINLGSVWATKNSVSGRFFGTTTPPATGTENNYVFLPAASSRNGCQTTMYNIDTCGYYCSSTAYGNTGAYALYFGSTGIGIYGDNNRDRGFSIRCVK